LRDARLASLLYQADLLADHRRRAMSRRIINRMKAAMVIVPAAVPVAA
jgi:hypothetical protein